MIAWWQMKESSQPAMQPSGIFTQEMSGTTTGAFGFSERILGILMAQPLNPIVKMEMRSMGRTEQEVRLAGGN